MKFNPVLTATDFPKRKNLEVFKPFFEALKASKKGILCGTLKKKWKK